MTCAVPAWSRNGDRRGLLAHLEAAVEREQRALGQATPRGMVRLHLLVGTPRPCRDLYPYAHISSRDAQATANAQPVGVFVEHIFLTASWEEAEASAGEDGLPGTAADIRDTPRNGTAKDASDGQARTRVSNARLCYALECFVYTLPQHASAILYVSKIDSSGWGPTPPAAHLRPFLSDAAGLARPRGSFSLSRTLTRYFLGYFGALRHWNAAAPAAMQPDPSDADDGGVTDQPMMRHAVRVVHVAVHILARAQRAYLFPSSPDNPSKRMLSDAALIKWWRSVVSEAIADVRSGATHGDGNNYGEERAKEVGSSSSSSATTASASKGAWDVQPFYIVPGYSRLESHVLLPLPPAPGTARGALAEAGWRYGHPYSHEGAGLAAHEDLPPLPLFVSQPGSSTSAGTPAADAKAEGAVPPTASPSGIYANSAADAARRSIAALLPHFSDDPKSRFLDELARDAHEHVGPLKRIVEVAPQPQPQSSSPGSASAVDSAPRGEEGLVRGREDDEEEAARVSEAKRPKLDVHADGVQMASRSPSVATPRTITPQHRAWMREREALDRVSADEFWERMGFRQECCSGNAVGVFVVLFTRRAAATTAQTKDGTAVTATAAATASALRPLALSMAHPTVQDLAFNQLMLDACVWSDARQAQALTTAWEQAASRAWRRKGGLEALKSTPSSSMPRRPTAGGERKDTSGGAAQATDLAEGHQPQGNVEGEDGKTVAGVTATTSSLDPLDEAARGIGWCEVRLYGASRPALLEAQEKWERAGRPQAAGVATAASSAEGTVTGQDAVQVNTLSVRRKKRPPPPP